MSPFNRRQFIKSSRDIGLGAAAMTILANPSSARATPVNDQIVLAAVGCGGRGTQLTQGFLQREDCRYAYACDPKVSAAGGSRSGEALADMIQQAQ